MQLPRASRLQLEAFAEIAGFLFSQSHISMKNLKRLTEMAASGDHEIREMAEVVLAVGKVHPARKRRLGWIKHRRPELWQRMLQVGLAEEWPEENGELLSLDESVSIEYANDSRSEYDEIPF